MCYFDIFGRWGQTLLGYQWLNTRPVPLGVLVMLIEMAGILWTGLMARSFIR